MPTPRAPWVLVPLGLCDGHSTCHVLSGLSTWQGEGQRKHDIHFPFVHLGSLGVLVWGLGEELSSPVLEEPRGWGW